MISEHTLLPSGFPAPRRSKLEASSAAGRWLPALRTTGAYLIGFAGADCRWADGDLGATGWPSIRWVHKGGLQVGKSQ